MEQTIKSFDGTNIYSIYERGEHPAIVFLHGVGVNWTMWKREVDFFREKSFSVLAPDLRGHGQSDAPEEFEKYQLPYFSRDLHALLVKNKIKKFILVGHSLGGGIAINYCMNYKNHLPQALVLVETASTYPFNHNSLLNCGPYLTKFLRFVASHEGTLQNNFFHFKDVDLSVRGVRANINLISHLMHLTPIQSIVKTLDNLEQFVFNNQSEIDDAVSNLPIPLLVIAGGKDQLVPPKFSRIMKKLNSDAELNILKNAQHTVVVDNAEEVCDLLYKFLKKDELV